MSMVRPYYETLNGAISTGDVSMENLNRIKSAGISMIEISCRYDKYFLELNFPVNAERIAADAKAAGISIWSIHLPFNRQQDISMLDDEKRRFIIDANRQLIEAAGRIGIKVAVLHPSSEPISDEERPERMRRSREAIIELNKVAQDCGVMLAVENLPRTCLCRTAEEMVELLNGTGAKVVFDTNHSLIQQNHYFIKTLAEAGLEIVSLHISDYDFVNERHLLPGDGLNNWTAIFAALQEASYQGPMLYEISMGVYGMDYAQAGMNMMKLKMGQIR